MPENFLTATITKALYTFNSGTLVLFFIPEIQNSEDICYVINFT